METFLKKRRRFLHYCLGFLGTIFAGGLLYPVFSYLQPPSRKKGGDIVKIPLSELPPGGMKRFHVRGIPAVAINSKEGYAAFSLVCSHLGCLVTWEGGKNEFLCPCHGAKFGSNGSVLSGPPPKGLERLNVEVKEGEIWVS
ncbi:MAG: Rieske 2Fe-2S domain-containing protein [Deltaproteobacteria bacterium]|nr:Rieske 2Fe-2S domain-containing protein [Deltaproteobacteria bacterium]